MKRWIVAIRTALAMRLRRGDRGGTFGTFIAK